MKKVVIKMSLTGDKSRPKAMEILMDVTKLMIPCEVLWNHWKPSVAKNRIKAMTVVAGIQGVLSVALDGEEKNQIVLIGDDFDPVNLIKLLRRNVGFADVVSVDSAYTEKKETADKKNEAPPPTVYPPSIYGGVPNFQVVELPDNPGCNCSIM